jgi:hypothetical protein
MSEGIAVSLIWLLAILVILNLVGWFFALYYLQHVKVGMYALNQQVLTWRKQFRDTFDSMSMDSGDIWGDEEEERT